MRRKEFWLCFLALCIGGSLTCITDHWTGIFCFIMSCILVIVIACIEDTENQEVKKRRIVKEKNDAKSKISED